jgi:peptidylprolyl isomerase
LVLAMLWLGGVGSLLAVVFGHVALARPLRTAAPNNDRGLAIAGLVLGYVGTVISLLLVASLVWNSGADDDDTSLAPPSTTVTSGTIATPTTGLSSCEDRNPTMAEDPHVLVREPPVPDPPPASTPAGALDVSIVIEGEDVSVTRCASIEAHYVGVLSDGSGFESSWDAGAPVTVTVGVGEVIAGWDQGLIGARLGERRHLVIGSDNAYRAQGSPDGTIPPNAPLAFDVDIIAIL